MKVNIQVSIYPFETECVEDSVKGAIKALEETGLNYTVNSMATIIGPCEMTEGMNAIQKLFNGVAENNKTVMTVTVSNVCGC